MKSLQKLALSVLLTVCCALLLGQAAAFAQSGKFPAYTGHVNDFANVIDPATEQKMGDILLNFEKKTGTQIAVVTMTTLGGQPLEDFSTDLYRTWGIGAKSGENRDKGALLLVVIQDRKTRLEVGYGLEGDLPDGLSGQIIRNMRADLQAANYSSAMIKGTRTIVDTLAAKWNISIEGIEDRRFAYQSPPPVDISAKGILILVFGIFVVVLLFIFFVMRFVRRAGGGVSAARRSGVAEAAWMLAPLIFNRGGGSFGGGSSHSGWGDSGGSSSGGSDWGGFGGGESGGGGASDSW